MSEETTLTVPTLQEQQTEPQGRQEVTIPSGNLGSNFFGGEQVEVQKPNGTQQSQTTTQTPAATVVEPAKKEEEEILEPNVFLKNTFGWENEEVGKAELQELRKLKETPPTFKFENDESRKMAEAIAKGDRKAVMQILDQQERLESLTTAEVSDDNAEAILKLAMQLKNKDAGLTQQEIDYKYNKEFGIPKEPVRRDDELDEEFEQRQAEWQDKVNDIKINRRMEAKLAKPELDKLKTQIVLPDISQSVQNSPSPEAQEMLKKIDEAYVQSVDNVIKNFNGLSVAVKNEVVNFPVTFGITNDDKTAISSLMQEFRNGNYDTNGLLFDLWVNEDRTLKTDRIVEDYYLLKNRDTLLSKIANDSATKAIDLYIKGKKNINVGATSSPGTAEFNKENKTELDTVRDNFFG